MGGGRWVRELCDSVRVVRWWRLESEAGRDVSSFLDKSKAVYIIYKPYKPSNSLTEVGIPVAQVERTS